jgi:Coenzyme PQQ synthesis protein D (PqqD)
MSPHHPKLASGLEIHEADEGLIVFQEHTDRVHHLNKTAAVILELCDGTRSDKEIAEAVGEIFGLDEPPEPETMDCIATLLREQLVS